MQLYLNDTSPFARFVLVTALEAGVEEMKLNWVDPWETPDSLTAVNPFSTVPALKVNDAPIIIESLLICQYLVQSFRKNHGSNPADARDLHRLSIGKTLMEMSLRHVILRRFVQQPEHCELYTRSKAGVVRALAGLDDVFRAPPANEPPDFPMADSCLALALSYVRFRLPELMETASNGIRANLDIWERKPSFELTSPQALKARPDTLAALKSTGRVSG